MSNQEIKEGMRCQVDLVESEIGYLKGRRRVKAKRAYYRLLQSCGKKCGLDEPLYLKRFE